MKKKLILLTTLVIGWVSNGVLLAQTLNIGYPLTDETIWMSDGLYLTVDAKAGAAIKVTQDMYKDFVGAKVEKIRMGWSDATNKGVVKVFVRRVLNDSTTNITTSEPTTVQYYGTAYSSQNWNTVTLKEPIVLNDSLGDFYVGYYVDLKANSYAISRVYPTGQKGACYMWRDEAGFNYDEYGKELWEDQSSVSTLALQLVANITGMKDRLMITDLSTPPIVTSDEEGTGLLTIKNCGTTDITKFTLKYTLGETTKETKITLSSALKTGKSATVTIPVIGIGSGDVKVSIEKLNIISKNNINTSREIKLLSIPNDVAKKYPRRGLVEFFESESEYHVPQYYDEYFYPGYKQYKDEVSLVAHHLNDQFMTGKDEETKMMLALVGNDSTQVYLPSESRDRTPQFVYKSSGTDIPIVYITMPDYSPALYNESLERPTCASIQIDEATASPNDEECNVKVSGKIAEGVMGDEHLYVTVYVLEDNVETNSQEQQDQSTGYYVHDNVVRVRMTPLFGKMVDVTEGKYEMVFNDVFDPEWKVKDMRVVAVLARSIDNGYRYANVMNCAEIPLTATTSIQTTQAQEYKYPTSTTFNLAGQRVRNDFKGIVIKGNKKYVQF